MRWLLALSGLLSLTGPVLAGNWKLDSSCQSSQYQGNATDGMKGGFTLTSQFHDVLDKIADKKPLAKHDDEIRKVLGWIFRKDKKKLDESTDLGPLRRRLKAISGSSKRDDKAEPDASTFIAFCDLKRLQKKQPKDEKPRWIDEAFKRVVTYDPELACKEPSKVYVINGQQPEKEVNQLQICPHFLKEMYALGHQQCDKWCWEKIADALKDGKPAPVDLAAELSTTHFFAFLFTAIKDTEGTACKTKTKRAQEKDDYKADSWAEHVQGDKTWLQIEFRGWRDTIETKASARKRDEKTPTKDPSAAAHAARAIDLILNQGLTIDEKGNVIPLEKKEGKD